MIKLIIGAILIIASLLLLWIDTLRAFKGKDRVDK
jgi:hypothetical protein